MVPLTPKLIVLVLAPTAQSPPVVSVPKVLALFIASRRLHKPSPDALESLIGVDRNQRWRRRRRWRCGWRRAGRCGWCRRRGRRDDYRRRRGRRGHGRGRSGNCRRAGCWSRTGGRRRSWRWRGAAHIAFDRTDIACGLTGARPRKAALVRGRATHYGNRRDSRAVRLKQNCLENSLARATVILEAVGLSDLVQHCHRFDGCSRPCWRRIHRLHHRKYYSRRWLSREGRNHPKGKAVACGPEIGVVKRNGIGNRHRTGVIVNAGAGAETGLGGVARESAVDN